MKQHKNKYSIGTSVKLFAVTTMLCGFALGAFAAPPANDDFVNAEIVSGIQVHIARTNEEATKEAGEPNHANNPGGKSLWFKWTAPMSRVMAITTNRSAGNFDTLLHIYKGAALNNLTSVAFSNNINAPSDLKSYARFFALEGTTYYIAVDGGSASKVPSAIGTFLLDIQPSFEFQGADYDADGMTDFSYFRPSNGTWYIFNSSSQQLSVKQWGTNGDIPLVASYSGGNNDYNVYRPSSSFWYNQPVINVNNYYLQWGTAGDIPVPANYGGGPGTETAVFRPSNGTWYISYSETEFNYYYFGQAGDIPVPGHYSPDLVADVAVFRPSNGVWYFIKRKFINPSHPGDISEAVQFGQAGDKPVPADYDGDGVLDVAVFRPSTGVWYVRRSSDNEVQSFQWGIAEDVPTTGDFDGDGKFDFAVFRPSNGTWYVYRSGDDSFQFKHFGQSGDIPVTANRTF